MSRGLKLTKGRFMREYRKASTMMALAVALDVSVPTVYNYCKRLNIDSKKKTIDIKLSIQVFNGFKNNVSVSDLIEMFHQSRQMVRYHLNRAIFHIWKTDPQTKDFPKPVKLTHIKVYHALRKNSKLMDNPEKLAEITGNTFYVVEQYLSSIFQLKTEKSKSKKKSKRRKS